MAEARTTQLVVRTESALVPPVRTSHLVVRTLSAYATVPARVTQAGVRTASVMESSSELSHLAVRTLSLYSEAPPVAPTVRHQHVWSKHPLPDPPTYYGGWKE